MYSTDEIPRRRRCSCASNWDAISTGLRDAGQVTLSRACSAYSHVYVAITEMNLRGYLVWHRNITGLERCEGTLYATRPQVDYCLVWCLSREDER